MRKWFFSPADGGQLYFTGTNLSKAPLQPLKHFPHLSHGLHHGVNLKAMVWAAEVLPHLSKQGKGRISWDAPGNSKCLEGTHSALTRGLDRTGEQQLHKFQLKPSATTQ